MVARLALAGLAASGLAIALGAAGGASPWAPSSSGGFPGWMAGPLGPLAPAPLDETFWLFPLAMAACYLVALALSEEIGPRLAIGTVVALHVIFLIAPPLLTTDPFGYLAYARMAGLDGVSPYASGLDALGEEDPVRAFFGWERGPSPYGPLFTVASYALVPLGLAGGLWALKALTAAGSLLMLALVWDLAPRMGRSRVAALLFAGLNPVLLVWAVGGAHNDLVVAALVLASMVFLVRRREGLAGVLAAAAVGVKASVGLLLPLLVLGARARGRALVGAVVGLVLGAGAGLLVLGVRGFAGYPRALAEQAGFVTDNSLVYVAGSALGLGGATAGVRLAATGILVVGVAALCIRVARRHSEPGAEVRLAGAWAWAMLLWMVTTAWLMVWYVVLVLPLAAVVPDRRLRVATLALCVFVVLMRVPLRSG